MTALKSVLVVFLIIVADRATAAVMDYPSGLPATQDFDEITIAMQRQQMETASPSPPLTIKDAEKVIEEALNRSVKCDDVNTIVNLNIASLVLNGVSFMILIGTVIRWLISMFSSPKRYRFAS